MVFMSKETITLMAVARCKGYVVTQDDLFGETGWIILYGGKAVATCKTEEQIKSRLEEIIGEEGAFAKRLF